MSESRESNKLQILALNKAKGEMDTIKKMRGEMEETHSACSAVETNS